MWRHKFLDLFFQLLYTKLAWAYDLVAWLVSAGQWYRWVETCIPFIEAGPVLEVGCGRGRLLSRIAAQKLKVVGVDRALEMATYAARESGEPVLQGDGQQLPFPDGYFATLITTFPAPYVLVPETADEFARVLCPGGLWLWVDAPALNPAWHTTLARLITRVAVGNDSPSSPPAFLFTNASEQLWSVSTKRVAVGATSIGIRMARRLPVSE